MSTTRPDLRNLVCISFQKKVKYGHADVYPVCDYWGFNPFRCSNGIVFLAVVHSIGELPESEMQEIGMFDELPENLTYPQTSPVLYRIAEKLLKSLVSNP